MCNHIHDEHEPIPYEGTGWKLFRYNWFGSLMPLLWNMKYKKPLFSKRIVWHDKYIGAGFCFFLDHIIALQALKEWKSYSKNVVLKEICYYRGVCKQIEGGVIGGISVEVGLCKEFKVV